MDEEEIFDSDSDSDLEELFQSGYEVKIIHLDSIEQFKKYEKEIDKITGINDNPNVVQYIKIKPR